MRLLCINNKPIPQTKSTPEKLALLKEGECYDGVLMRGLAKGLEVDCYYIPELKWKYHTSRFVKLSDLDETELVAEEFNEKYCEPVNC